MFQFSNGDPPPSLHPAGDITVTTETDDDFVGWVFGWQSATSFYVAEWKARDSTSGMDYDSEDRIAGGIDGTPRGGGDQSRQYLAKAGLQIKRVSGTPADWAFWSTEDLEEVDDPANFENVKLIYQDENRVGWEPSTEYHFETTVNNVADTFQVVITEELSSGALLTVVDTGVISPGYSIVGGWGPFAFSQPDAQFSNLNFACLDVESPPAR